MVKDLDSGGFLRAQIPIDIQVQNVASSPLEFDCRSINGHFCRKNQVKPSSNYLKNQFSGILINNSLKYYAFIKKNQFSVI